MVKKALITGVTGQDGSYLAEFFLGKGMRFVELNAVPHLSILSVPTIFTRIRMSIINSLFCTTVI